MIYWIANHADLIGAVIAVAGFILSLATLSFSAYRFVEVRRAEQRQLNFENYHKLIGALVGGSDINAVLKVDSQIAIIFELRNFREYADVSIRILNGLIDEWSERGFPSRLIEEMRLTVAALS
jgi:hypothetical protein